jgi:hypothetical protein
MAEVKNLEPRLKAALEDPYASNQNCSECDREQNTPVWAAFLVCPVDNRRLGVVCCKKCYKLFQDVKDEDCDFTIKSLTELNDCKCPHAGARPLQQDMIASSSNGDFSHKVESLYRLDRKGRNRTLKPWRSVAIDGLISATKPQ